MLLLKRRVDQRRGGPRVTADGPAPEHGHWIRLPSRRIQRVVATRPRYPR